MTPVARVETIMRRAFAGMLLVSAATAPTAASAEPASALPDNLQYGFFGRHIVLLDGDTPIIIDYVPNVLPPH